MSDTTLPQGARNQNADFTAPASGSAIPKLSALSPDAGAVKLAVTTTTPQVIYGFALNAAALGAEVQVKSSGVVVGTPEEWNAVSDEDDGLVDGAAYFVSTTAGKITQTRLGARPAVGVAVGKTTLVLATPTWYTSA